MIIRKILFTSLLLTISFSQGKVGTAIFRWAEIETGTRAVGMAGSQVASGNEVSALPYNPASICFIKNTQIFSSATSYLAGTQHYTMAYGKKLTPSDFIGVHIYVFNSGDIPEATALLGLTGKQFQFQGLAARLSYARKVTDRLNLGATFKFLRESTTSADLTMSGIGFDIGSNFDTGIYGMMLGMCISNFGPKSRYVGDGLDSGENVQFKTEYHPLPLTFRVGLEKKIIQNGMNTLSVSADAINPLDYNLYGTMGAEFSFQNLGSIRAGYHLGHDTASFTAGAGLEYKNFTIDAAYSNYGILEGTVQFGLGYKF